MTAVVTNVSGELALIEEIKRHATDEADAARRKRTATLALRRAGEIEDARLRTTLITAYRDAKAKADATEQSIADTTAALQGLVARQKSGDRTVSAEEVNTLRGEIEAQKNYLLADSAAARRADQAQRPFLADNHCAYLAADVMQPWLSVPIVIRKRPQDAPPISPAVVLSQITPSVGYGTVETSGTVTVTLVGEPVFDLRVIRQALEDAGCDADATEDSIVFRRAVWPVPVIAKPDRSAVDKLANRLLASWRSQIEDAMSAEEAERLRSLGYPVHPSSLVTGNAALSERLSVTFASDDGLAAGTVRLALSIEQPYGHVEIEQVEAEARELVRAARELVGTRTEAGEITGVELTAVDRGDGSIWDRSSKGVQTAQGLRIVHLPTVEAEFRVGFRYTPAASGIVGD